VTVSLLHELVALAEAARREGVGVVSVRTFPHPRQKYLPLPGLSPDVYGMKRKWRRNPIKGGLCGG
jgi:hypothetical protein